MKGCCVKGCKSKSGPNISLHRFPKKSPFYAAWIEATGRSNWTPAPYNRICSLHFEKKYFDLSGRLMGLAVPKLNIHQRAVIPSSSQFSNVNNLHSFKDYAKPLDQHLTIPHRDHTYAKIEVEDKTVLNGAVVDVSEQNVNNNLMQSPALTTLYSLNRNLHINEPNDQTVANQSNVVQVGNHPETNSLPGHPNIKLQVSRPSLPASVPKGNLAGSAKQITAFGNLVLIVEPPLSQPENQPFSKKICCIGSCTSDASNVNEANGLHFHRFPHDASTSLKWVEIVRQTRKNSFWTPSDDDVVCSKHFRPADIFREGRNWTLLSSAVPTECLQSKEGKEVGVKKELSEIEEKTSIEERDVFHEKIAIKKEVDIDNLKKHYGTIIEKLNEKLQSKQITIIRQRNKLATLRKQLLRQKIKINKMEDQIVSLKAV